MRTIRITGKGEIKVKPDVTRITVTLFMTTLGYRNCLCCDYMCFAHFFRFSAADRGLAIC